MPDSTEPASLQPLIAEGVPPDLEKLRSRFSELCEIIAKLRSPEGCPWDRQQTLESIKPYTLEETYELLEAIDSGDDGAIVEELGDVLLQVLLDSQIAADQGRFDLNDVVDVLARKLVRRHPHVFGDVKVGTANDVALHWDRIKRSEKTRQSIFDGLPAELPALARAARLSKKAARVGYDFPTRNMLFDKLQEEITELAFEIFPAGKIPHVEANVDVPVEPDPEPFTAEQQRRIESEIGDVLFVVANIARRWHINPEEALRASNAKFQRRVEYIERRLKETGRDIHSASLTEMEELYQEGKQIEKSGKGEPR
ncbi:nucleoside triphosphate pyrophosphohydrolase [Schlesneria sp.]|uniref:nucleoside triphosphate pyrophosphohydrolase n=1 Tax=Schlesneria sp. TaxID=2762018 RepID=UPI002EE64C2B